MRIEEVIKKLRWLSYEAYEEDISLVGQFLSEYADAIEQHHKDLMGLVERWRDREAEFWKRKDDYSFGLHQAYGYAADDLESLINPKD